MISIKNTLIVSSQLQGFEMSPRGENFIEIKPKNFDSAYYSVKFVCTLFWFVKSENDLQIILSWLCR